ncbi:HPr kinase/phosphatase C-terminal domain-containing protein [Sphingomonas sabuli]|uniref:HPr kinase/phosphatase C-terminal domain-containing protein n=1 Tax=Sphingomonas sabuli TaxID=2764186 RepID=A0A7G9L336_9SPHN|nr:HPr kinase/phosphatase C-terminal domain-containing protein [Sphingomonas sabuli]QNM83035.1 HPr kinase/phosphatase C-terminal domain-containing protein [Sphingomonas sabuli]
MTPPLSSETVHATCVASAGRAVLILGPSGSGKSDLALRLLDRGFQLVSDDRTIISRDGGRLLASAPAQIAGKMEIRGFGIVDMESTEAVPIALAVELTSEVPRMPQENAARQFLGTDLPLVLIDAMTASAPSKVALALERFGLKSE